MSTRNIAKINRLSLMYLVLYLCAVKSLNVCQPTQNARCTNRGPSLNIYNK